MLTGVIIANTGSPAAPDPDAVEEYLRDFLMDDRIRQVPKPLWRWIVHKHILPRRKFSSAKRYARVWTPEGSPLVAIQERLACKVQERFAGTEVLVRSAMSYGSPDMADVLRDLRAEGAERIVLLPLYPQSAHSSTMAVVDAFGRARHNAGWHPPTHVIGNYHDHPLYVGAIADAIRASGFNAAQDDKLLFSFHAIPLKDEKAGDSYRAQICESTRLVAHELGIAPTEITVGYQSVFGHSEKAWTAPLTRDILARWRTNGFRVAFCCPGFAVDCLETLYDVPEKLACILDAPDGAAVLETLSGKHPKAHRKRPQAQSEGAGDAENPEGQPLSPRFLWIPSLNDSAAQVELVSALIGEAIAQDTWKD